MLWERLEETDHSPQETEESGMKEGSWVWENKRVGVQFNFSLCFPPFKSTLTDWKKIHIHFSLSQVCFAYDSESLTQPMRFFILFSPPVLLRSRRKKAAECSTLSNSQPTTKKNSQQFLKSTRAKEGTQHCADICAGSCPALLSWDWCKLQATFSTSIPASNESG